MMGDSIGPSIEEGAATLGPCLKFGDQCFWLANLHVFLKQLKSRTTQNLVLHPGRLDERACGHSIAKSHVKFGTVYASSGEDLTTTRPSSHPFWKRFPETTLHEVVTDWVLIDDFGQTELADEHNSKKQEPFLNTLRVPGQGPEGYVTITEFGPVLPEAKIHSTGRTSGHQYGQICEIPAYLDADVDRKTTKPTREWFVEQPSWITDSEDSWLEGGIGVPGDSGAPVIDSDDKTLYGQIWGRNKYWGPGPRVAYFTAMADISEDIQAKCPELQTALELPQHISRKRDIRNELYCPKCANPEENDTPQSSSDAMSIMSISSASEFNSPFDPSPNINPLEVDENPPDLQLSDVMQSDSGDFMSIDSADAQTSLPPIDDEELEELMDVLPPALRAEAELMRFDLDQFDGHSEYELGGYDETLLIDDEDDIPARSFATKKTLRSVISHEHLPDSWVMVQAKQTEMVIRPSKLPTKRPRKEAYSASNSLVRTSEVSGIKEIIYAY